MSPKWRFMYLGTLSTPRRRIGCGGMVIVGSVQIVVVVVVPVINSEGHLVSLHKLKSPTASLRMEIMKKQRVSERGDLHDILFQLICKGITVVSSNGRKQFFMLGSLNVFWLEARA